MLSSLLNRIRKKKAPESVVHSQTPMEKQRFTWQIANFADIRSSKRLLEAQTFRFDMGASIGLPTKWVGCLKVEKKENCDWIGIYIFLDTESVPQDVTEVLVTISMKIGYTGCYFNSGFSDAQDMLKSNVWGYAKIIPQFERKIYLPLRDDGSLAVDIDVTLFNSITIVVATPLYPLTLLTTQFQSKFLENLTRDLNTINHLPGCSLAAADKLQMVSRDETVFLANSKILAARSPTLRELIQVPGTQGKKWVSTFSHLSLDVILHFLQHGILKENWRDEGIIEELTHASHVFGLVDLKQFLDQALGQVCTKENAADLLLLARRLEMKQAKKDLMGYIKRNLNDDMLEQLILSAKEPENSYIQRAVKARCIGTEMKKILFRNA